MGGLGDEEVALRAIYGDEITFHDREVSLTLTNDNDGIRPAELTLCLPPSYPHEEPTYFVKFAGACVKSQDEELLQQISQTVENELSAQSLNKEYSLYSVIEAARSTAADYRRNSSHKIVSEHAQHDHVVPTTRDTAALHGIRRLSADELEKIFSWLDVERDLLRVSLVSRSFASSLRSNSVWRQFWVQRWGGDGLAAVLMDKHCSRAAFRSRFASESRWETDGGQPHIHMFKLMEQNAAVCKMCWVRSNVCKWACVNMGVCMCVCMIVLLVLGSCWGFRITCARYPYAYVYVCVYV
jgi:hypothetical protein